MDSWTVVFLSHARPLTHRCGRGVNFRVQVSLCGLCGGKEGRYHKEEEEDGIGCRFGNKDKETLESFSVVYLVHTTFPFPPSFPSVSLILSHQKWSVGRKVRNSVVFLYKMYFGLLFIQIIPLLLHVKICTRTTLLIMQWYAAV